MTSLPPTASDILARAVAQVPFMVRMRQRLHQVPEVGLHLPITQNAVLDELRSLGLEVEFDSHSSGLSARIPGTSAETVVLRADMDALPVAETNDLPFRSRHVGAMHACGHDLHTSMLLGLARALTETAPRHSVILAFQSGEEFDRGAVPLLAHRNLSGVRNARTFALHVHANLPAGSLHWRSGPFMGYGDWFEVSINGRGGHASAPQRALSPLTPAARLAVSIDSITDLQQQPWPTRVATTTEILGGNSVNVIPQHASLRGTIRGKDLATMEGIRGELRSLVAQEQSASGTQIVMNIVEGYPAVMNAPDATAHAVSLGRDLFGDDSVREMPETSMVIEDYSYFTERWPGSMLYLGASVPGFTAFNHSPDVMFNEEAMRVGCTLLLSLANM